jgi:hypothetical protein
MLIGPWSKPEFPVPEMGLVPTILCLRLLPVARSRETCLGEVDGPALLWEVSDGPLWSAIPESTSRQGNLTRCGRCRCSPQHCGFPAALAQAALRPLSSLGKDSISVLPLFFTD